MKGDAINNVNHEGLHPEIKPSKIKHHEGLHHEIKHPEIKPSEIKHHEIKHPEIKHPEIKHPEKKPTEEKKPTGKKKPTEEIKKSSHIQLILSVLFVLVILIVAFVLIYYLTNWFKPSSADVDSTPNEVKCENFKNKLKQIVDDKCIVITCEYGINKLGTACNTTCTNVGSKVISVVSVKGISVCTTVYNCAPTPNGKVSGIASDKKHCNAVCTADRHNDYDGNCILSCDYGMAGNNLNCNDTCVNTKNKYATGYDIGGTCKYKFCQYGAAKNENNCNDKCNPNYPNTFNGKCSSQLCPRGVAECKTKCNSNCTALKTMYQSWFVCDDNDDFSCGYSYSGKCNYNCVITGVRLYPSDQKKATNIWYDHKKNNSGTCRAILKSCITNWRTGKYSCCPTSCNGLCRSRLDPSIYTTCDMCYTDISYLVKTPCSVCSGSGIYSIGDYKAWYKVNITPNGMCGMTETCFIDENQNILDDCWHSSTNL